MIVVDASVAVKWLIAEPGEDAAQALLDGGGKLAAPELIRVEVAAAIARKARLNQISDDEAQETLEEWFRGLAEGSLTLAPDEEDIGLAVRMALTLKHPLADCLYLALAHRLAAPLITADRKFVERASGAYPELRLLDDAPS